MTRRVWNKRDPNCPKEAIYVGRPTKFGNPYTHLKGKTLARFQVPSAAHAVEAFKTWLLSQPELIKAAKAELRGKDLVCWCKPGPCHADILMEVANAPE